MPTSHKRFVHSADRAHDCENAFKLVYVEVLVATAGLYDQSTTSCDASLCAELYICGVQD